MKKVFFLLNFLLITIVLVSCGSESGTHQTEGRQDFQSESNQEPRTDIQKNVMETVQRKMERMEQQIDVMTARNAYKVAIEEAKKWDKNANLYYLEGEKSFKADGTAKQWTAYFAVREDPQNTPGKEQGKKLVVLMLGGMVVNAEKKETPDDIKFTQDCYKFLPNDWMDSEMAFGLCMDVLRERYGDDTDKGETQTFVCFSAEHYISGKWVIKPTWQLSHKIGDTYARVKIHAVSGDVLAVK